MDHRWQRQTGFVSRFYTQYLSSWLMQNQGFVFFYNILYSLQYYMVDAIVMKRLTF